MKIAGLIAGLIISIVLAFGGLVIWAAMTENLTRYPTERPRM